jgi:hypothetical protein
MAPPADFTVRLQLKVSEQLQSQRVGYLLGAGSSYLDGRGYPLAGELWNAIKDRIKDTKQRADIQAKLDSGATGLEQALDGLDDGSSGLGTHRVSVVDAIAELFESLNPPLDVHVEFSDG